MALSLPVTLIQILWINLITAVTLGIALAFEPTKESTMHRPPRPRNESLLTGGLVWHIILVCIPFGDGVLIIITGAIFFAVIEIEKQLRLRISVIRHVSAGENARYGDGVL